jgi:hypothetical protein
MALAVRRCGDVALLPALRKRQESETDPEVQKHIQEALSRLESPGVAPRRHVRKPHAPQDEPAGKAAPEAPGS